MHAIVVDGYERLHRGRHDLPFLLMRKPPPPVIVWSATGYYPNEPPSWLSEHRRLQVAADDLPYILELDGDLDDDAAPSLASLWEAATTSAVQKIHAPWTTRERAVLASIDELMRVVRSSGTFPTTGDTSSSPQPRGSARSLRLRPPSGATSGS